MPACFVLGNIMTERKTPSEKGKPPVDFACFVLIISGVIFNFFNERYGNLYISWLIHMGANFAINGDCNVPVRDNMTQRKGDNYELER